MLMILMLINAYDTNADDISAHDTNADDINTLLETFGGDVL